MPASTPVYALPYPLNTDPVTNGDDTIKALAERVEALMRDRSQAGTVSMSWASNTITTLAVTFPRGFASTPRVFTNITSGDGSVARWGSRCSAVTTSGFTMMVFAGFGGPAQVGSGIPVAWFATVDN
jgi:hypothetical protein